MLLSCPHPDIDPVYYQTDDVAPWRRLTRHAVVNRASGNATTPSEPATKSEISANAPPPAAPAAIRSGDTPTTTLSSPATRAVPAHGRFSGRERLHPPTQASPTRLRHVRRVVDRKGGVRVYYVRGPGPHIRLPDDDGTPSFLQAYEIARRVKTLQCRLAQQPARPRRCVEDLVDLYLRSAEYARLAPQTQRVYARVLRRLCKVEDMTGCSVAALDRRRLQRHLDRHAEAPAAAADQLKKLRALMRCAIAHGWRADDPTQGINLPPGGHHRPWTAAEIAAFEARWPAGTRQHAAFTLLHHTGRRGAEIVRMTWADIDRLGRSPELARALASWQQTHALVLPTRAATAFTPHGFGNLMTAAIASAGLPPTCTPDGLRRSVAQS